MRFLIVFLTLFVLNACVAVEDYSVIRNDLRNLQSDSFQHKKEIFEVQNKLSSLEKNSMGGAIRENQEELNARVSQLNRELQVLRGRFDEKMFAVDNTLEENKTDRDILGAQIITLENQLKEFQLRLLHMETELRKKGIKIAPQPFTMKKEVQPEQIGHKVEKKEAPKENPDSVYKEALKTFETGKYKEARDMFQQFAEKYGDSKLADNAHFWIAESYYKEKNYEDAIIAYETMIKLYSRSDKVPGALYKQALSFSELPDKKTTKVILEQIIERFPGSKEESLAKQKLKELKKGNKKKQ